jgi:hypothetical protein
MEVWGLRPGGRHLGLLPLLSFQATYIVCILCPVAVRFWPLLSAPVQSYFLVQSQQETFNPLWLVYDPSPATYESCSVSVLAK